MKGVYSQLETIVGLIRAIAWPFTIFALAILFRHEVRAVLGRLSRLKYKELEATFDESLREVERIASAVTIPPLERVRQSEKLTPGAEERLDRLVEISPRAAITEAWIEVESAISFAAERLGISSGGAVSQAKIVQMLHEKRIMNDEVVTTYNRLRSLRNEAIHAQDFALPITETERYVDLAKGLAAFIHFKGQLTPQAK
jgi:hypothetical protein